MIRKAPWTKEEQQHQVRAVMQTLGHILDNLERDEVELVAVKMDSCVDIPPLFGHDELHLTFDVSWIKKREDAD